MTTDEDPGLSLNMGGDDYESEDEQEIRDRAGLNSPKPNKAMVFTEEDNNKVGLNLSGDNNTTGVTPNTAFRDEKGINSPREQHTHNSSQAKQIYTNPGNLMTQVPNPGGLMTQVPRPDAGSVDTTEEALNSQLTQTNAGFCSCFSSLWCCGSSPHSIPPASIPLHENSANSQLHQQSYNQDKISAGSNSSLVADDDHQTDIQLVSDNNTLVRNDNEDSMSSTDYPLNTLLPPLHDEHMGKKCLVLDLDETLVHSSFKPISDPHFVIPVEIDRVVHHVYVLKRPFVDDFLLKASLNYEIVIFTASLSKYADPLLDKLDIHNVISHRLFRESCVIHGTAYVKDLRKIGRPLKDLIIVDNSPPSYLFQPANAIPIASWFDDVNDRQLLELLPVLNTTLKHISDVRCVLDANKKTYRWLCQQANKPLNLFTVKNKNP